ncbi:MAG: radical SAM protein [Armatimonadia bacterium]
MEEHVYVVDGREYLVQDDPENKTVSSELYNMRFNKQTGHMARWGRTLEEDPAISPAGPEILDLEVSAGGCPNKCPWCYKQNGERPAEHMSLATFKAIIAKFPKTLTQVAFGITGVQSNPDFIPMMEHCRSLGIVPNFTLSGIDLTPELADRISKLAGAVAVSVYDDRDLAYNTVKAFTDRGMRQVNIHLLTAAERGEHMFRVLLAAQRDERLKDLNAVVFLGVKPKGGGRTLTPLSDYQFGMLTTFCLVNKLRFGFDSCSAFKFQKYVTSIQNAAPETTKALLELTEPCESSCFSSYVNVRGEYWNCSFSEGAEGVAPVNVLAVEDFLRDLWYKDAVVAFRQRVIDARGQRSCPVYDLDKE